MSTCACKKSGKRRLARLNSSFLNNRNSMFSLISRNCLAITVTFRLKWVLRNRVWFHVCQYPLHFIHTFYVKPPSGVMQTFTYTAIKRGSFHELKIIELYSITGLVHFSSNLWNWTPFIWNSVLLGTNAKSEIVPTRFTNLMDHFLLGQRITLLPDRPGLPVYVFAGYS